LIAFLKNSILYKTSGEIWKIFVQTDGNLILLHASYAVKWACSMLPGGL
jgi:hypothetical protein